MKKKKKKSLRSLVDWSKNEIRWGILKIEDLSTAFLHLFFSGILIGEDYLRANNKHEQ
jgi:hypothetical protein